jgi:hypothetical protein
MVSCHFGNNSGRVLQNNKTYARNITLWHSIEAYASILTSSAITYLVERSSFSILC